VLVAPVDTRLKTIIETVAAAYGFTVHAMEVMPDHLHLFIAADPTLRRGDSQQIQGENQPPPAG